MYFTGQNQITWTLAPPAAPVVVRAHPGGGALTCCGGSYWGDALPESDTFELYLAGVLVDMATKRVTGIEFVASYDSGYSLSFVEKARHYLGTWKPEDRVEVRINHTTRFLGWILQEPRSGAPGEQVSYSATDARFRANRVVVKNAQGVPRVVFNSEPEDEDYESAMSGLTTGEIIAWLFENHRTELEASGVSAVYVQDELDALTGVPGRIGIREQGFDRALLSVLSQQPGVRHRVNPHTGVWHFDRESDLPELTITYNDDLVSRPTIARDLSECATAILVVGDEQITDETATLQGSGLEEYWDDTLEATWTRRKAFTDDGSVEILDNDALVAGDTITVTVSGAATVLTEGVDWDIEGTATATAESIRAGAAAAIANVSVSRDGTQVVIEADYNYEVDGVATTASAAAIAVETGPAKGYEYVGRRYRIVDPLKRAMAKTRQDGTCLKVYKKRAADSGHWVQVRAQFLWRDGIFVTDNVMLGANADASTEGGFVPAYDMKLVYAYLGEPLTARAPAAGYEGSAYSVCGMQYERTIHMPEFRKTSQQADVDAFAAQVLAGVRNVRWSGSVPLVGTQAWDWFFLGRVVNLASQDNEGTPIVTGMEAIAALMTEVRISRLEYTTTISFATGTSAGTGYDRLLQDLLSRQRMKELDARTTQMNRTLKLSECQHGIDPDVDFQDDRDTMRVYNDWNGSVTAGQAVVPTGETIEIGGVEYEKVTRPEEDSQEPAYLSATPAEDQADIFEVYIRGARKWFNVGENYAEFIAGDNLGTVAASFSLRRDHTGIGVVLAVKANYIKVEMGAKTEMIGVKNAYGGAVTAGSVVEIYRQETDAEEPDDEWKRTVVGVPRDDNLKKEQLLIMAKPFTALNDVALAWKMTGRHLVRVEKQYDGHDVTYAVGEALRSQKNSFLAFFGAAGFGTVTTAAPVIDVHGNAAITAALGQDPKYEALQNTISSESVTAGDVVAILMSLWGNNQPALSSYGRRLAVKPKSNEDSTAMVVIRGGAVDEIILATRDGEVRVNTDDSPGIGQEMGAVKNSLKASSSRKGLGKVVSLIGGIHIEFQKEKE